MIWVKLLLFVLYCRISFNTYNSYYSQGNNARLSLPTWLPRNPPGTHQSGEGLQRPQSSIAHVNLGPGAQTFILNERGVPSTQRQSSQGMSTSASNDSNISEQGPENVEINVSVNPSNNNNIHDNGDNDSQSDDGMAPQVSF